MRESATMALTAIAAHKLRSALTLLGVLVGVSVPGRAFLISSLSSRRMREKP